MNFKTLLLILIFSLSSSLFASNQTYTIKIESLSKETMTASQDIKRAFQQLTQKLSPSAPLSNPSYETIANIIEQYQYVEEENKLFLLIEFDKKTMRDYLSQNNLDTTPLPSDKPLLLYVAQKVGGKNSLLDIETNAALIETIIQEALKQGFSLISPTFDISDIESINFDDIWQNNISKLKTEIERYQTQGVLIVKLQREEGEEWQSEWDLYQRKKHAQTRAFGAPIKALTAQALQKIKEQPATHRQINQYMMIEALHLNSEETYQSMFNSLKKTPGVLSVQIDSVTPDSVFYKLSINTDKDELINKLKGHKNFDKIKVSP